MTDKAIRERHYHAFLSHAHVDKALVDRLHDLLARSAGLPIWYDSTSLQATKTIASELPDCISQCRAIVLVLSQASVNSGWVKEEYNYAIGQRTRHPKFQVIPIRRFATRQNPGVWRKRMKLRTLSSPKSIPAFP